MVKKETKSHHTHTHYTPPLHMQCSRNDIVVMNFATATPVHLLCLFPTKQIFIAGGAEVYSHFAARYWPQLARVYCTILDDDFDCDTHIQLPLHRGMRLVRELPVTAEHKTTKEKPTATCTGRICTFEADSL